MSLIDPLNRYNPIPLGRGRRNKLPSFRTTVLLVVILLSLLSLKGFWMDNYNFIKGFKHWNQGELELASMEFRKVLARSPGNAKAIDGLGLVEVKEGHLDKAREAYRQAINAGLTYSRRFDHLKTGQTFMDEGKYPEAELELQHALELQPNSPEIYVALGTVERALGQVLKGEKYYMTAQQYDKKNKKVKELLHEVQEEETRGYTGYIFDRTGSPLAVQWTEKNRPKNGDRGYPMGKEFAHLIGWLDPEETYNRGSAGLENAYKDYLPGNKLYLTLDNRIQRVIFKAMGWQKGSIIVLNPHTGEILGCISQPTFTPDHIHSDWRKYLQDRNTPLLNRAFEGLYEPGSIIKIVTSAAALEKNLDLKKIFPLYCKGYQYIDNQLFFDWQKHKTVKSLEEAFDASCNMSFARLGFELGADTLLEFNNRFGFNNTPKTINIPLAMGFTPKLGLSRYELAQAATGLGKGFRTTPLNAAMIASSIANDGVLMSPYLVDKLTNVQGKVLQENKPQVLSNVISRQTSQFLTTMMLNDVERGIGVKARVKGIKVAGKTGTSGSRDPNFHAWFICFAPAESPKIAVAILAEFGGTGKDIAAPIAKKVIEGIMDIPGYLTPETSQK